MVQFQLVLTQKTDFDQTELVQAVFVSRKVISGKSFSKLSCICLLLENLVNEKYFPVNGKHFPIKEKFGLIFRKVFSFYFGRKTLSFSFFIIYYFLDLISIILIIIYFI